MEPLFRTEGEIQKQNFLTEGGSPVANSRILSRLRLLNGKYMSALFLLILISPGAVTAFAGPTISAERISIPNKTLTNDEQRALYQAGNRLLMHVDRARQAIKEKNKESALDNVNKGLTLVQIIENAEPQYTVKTTIKSGNMVYQDENKVKPVWVPIYSELDEISMEAPITAVKTEAKKTGKMSGVPEITLDDATLRGKISLDVNLAKDHLGSAKDALSAGKLDDADKVLAAIEANGVSFSFDLRDRPLIQARENLMEAQTMISEGKNQDAKIALQSASDALAEYTAISKGNRSSQVADVRKEIDSLNKEVTQGNKDKEGLLKKITAIWDKVVHWI